MLCSCLFFLFGFIFFTTLITHYFCSFESESSNGPRFKPDGVTGSGLPLQSGMTDYPRLSISADAMPSARPEWIGLQLTTGLWVSATFSCSGVGQGFCYGHPVGIRLIVILAQRETAELVSQGHLRWPHQLDRIGVL